MIKIEIHDDLIDWLHNRLVLSTREECVEFVQELVSFATMTKAMTVENTDLLAERDALREALKFYADPASWKRKRCKQGGWPIAESQPVLKDRGERARDSLDAAEEAA